MRKRVTLLGRIRRLLSSSGSASLQTTNLRSMTNGYNFTERVRKVLAQSREAASDLHHEYVGTEHILLGLLREGEGVASAVMQALHVDVAAVQQRILEQVKKGRADHLVGPDLP